MLYQNCDNFQKKPRENSSKLLFGVSKYKVLRGPPPKPQKEMHRGFINGSFWPSNSSKLLMKGMLKNIFRTVTEKIGYKQG